MITKRKGLYLGLLLSLLGQTQKGAFVVAHRAGQKGIELQNNTTKKVNFYVDYLGSVCKIIG